MYKISPVYVFDDPCRALGARKLDCNRNECAILELGQNFWESQACLNGAFMQ